MAWLDGTTTAILEKVNDIQKRYNTVHARVHYNFLVNSVQSRYAFIRVTKNMKVVIFYGENCY